MLWHPDHLCRRKVDDLHKALTGLPQERIPVLWMIIMSSGGELDSAYHMARLLQQRCDKLCAAIPRWAKSAATLLTLGCDEFVMHPLAELGPLDAQVEIIHSGTRRHASTLDALKSIEYLRTYSVDTFDRLMLLMNRRSDADNQAASAMAANALKTLVEPIFAQVDPVQMGEYSRALDLASRYGERLMKRPYAHLAPGERNAILRKLIEHYPAHSFVIDSDEARELRLNIRAPTPEEFRILEPCATIDHIEGESEERTLLLLPQVSDTNSAPLHPTGMPARPKDGTDEVRI